MSYVIYEGPSVIDGSRIVVLAVLQSANSKTGGMLQTHVMLRDEDPRSASQIGSDFSICGHCKFRGTASNESFTRIEVRWNKKGRAYVSVPAAKNRACYVNLGQGPLAAWKAYKRGNAAVSTEHAEIAALGSNQAVRLGSYGDPAAVPADVWQALISQARTWTGYSHQAGVVDSLAELCMQSADTVEDAERHWAEGRRTFRVLGSVDEMQDNEILCPASREGGQKTTCVACKLCNGTSKGASPRSVAVVAHGAGKKHAQVIVKG